MAKYKYILLVVFSTLTTFLTAQYSIRGEIYVEGQQPAFAASVYLHETKQGVSADSTGAFHITNVKKGRYHIHISLVGYKSTARDIEITDKDVFVTIQLIPSSLEVNEVIIESNALKLSQQESSVELIAIDEGYLQKNMGTTLMNSLDKLPGINSINMGTGVSKPVIRGMSFNRVAVADNGIKQQGQQWGGDHGLEIDQFSVEQVEILKGPASLVYGSDAIGGVVNLKHPISPMEGSHSAAVLTNYKSVNNTYGVSAQAKGNHKGFVYRARLTALDYGDYNVPADSFTYNRYVLPIYDQKLKNTAGRERHASLMLGVNKNWGYSHVTISNYNQQIGVFSGALGIPRAYQLTPDDDERDIDLPNQDINHFKIISNTNIQIGKNWMEIDAGYQNNLRDENSSPHAHGVGPTPSGTLAHRLRLQTFSTNVRYHAKTLKVLDGVYGISSSYQINRFDGFEFLLPNFNAFNIGAFAVEKWHVSKRLIANAGLRFDYGNVAVERHLQPVWRNATIISGYTERNPGINRNFYSWSGSIGAAFNPNNFWSFKLNFGKSFRMPTPQELSVNGLHHGSFRHELGDATLLPENGYQTDVVIAVEKEKFLFSVSPFFNYFTNYIYLRPTARFSPLPEGGQMFQFTQAEAIYSGGEFTAEYHPTKQLHLSVTGDLVYTYNITENLPLPFTPPPSLKSEVEWEIPKILGTRNLYIQLSHQYFETQNRVDRNEPITPSYQLWNVGAGFDIETKGKKRATVLLQVQNLGNTRYLNHLSRWRFLNLPEPGRNFVVSVIIPVLDKN